MQLKIDITPQRYQAAVDFLQSKAPALTEALMGYVDRGGDLGEAAEQVIVRLAEGPNTPPFEVRGLPVQPIAGRRAAPASTAELQAALAGSWDYYEDLRQQGRTQSAQRWLAAMVEAYSEGYDAREVR